MKKGCVYCDAMHANRCPDAFSDVAQYCGKYDNEDCITLATDECGIGVGKIAPIPVTVYINDCDHIKLTAKGIDLSFEIEPEELSKVGEIIINGIKFVKEMVGDAE